MRSRLFTTQSGALLYTHIAALRNAVFAMAAFGKLADIPAVMARQFAGIAPLSNKIHTT